MLITDAGTLVRTSVAEVSSLGRNTQGVRLIRLSDGEKLVEITAIDESDAQAADDGSEDEDEVSDTENSASSDDAGALTDAGTPVPDSGDDNDDTETGESDDSDEPGDAT